MIVPYQSVLFGNVSSVFTKWMGIKLNWSRKQTQLKANRVWQKKETITNTQQKIDVTSYILSLKCIIIWLIIRSNQINFQPFVVRNVKLNKEILIENQKNREKAHSTECSAERIQIKNSYGNQHFNDEKREEKW